MKKYFAVVFVFLIGSHVAHAALEINEIMYDPKGANAGHQWIEVYNSGTDQVSIDDTWRFNDGSSHYINGKNAFVVPPQFYFILTGNKDTFLADHPSYAGTVIDTSMSLDKDGDTVSLLSSGETVAQATYASSMGGSQDSDSLQKINNAWVEAPPTPGVENAAAVSAPAPVLTQNPAPIVSNTEETTVTPDPVVTATNNPTQSQSTPAVTIPAPIPATPVPSPVVYQDPIVAVTPTPIATPIQPPVMATPIPLPVSVPVVVSTPMAKKKVVKKKPVDTTASTDNTTSEDPIDLSTLGADAGESKTSTIALPTLAWVGLAFLIIIGLASILFMKKKRKPTDTPINEEELDPEDMALVE
jgi:hypothetical protein